MLRCVVCARGDVPRIAASQLFLALFDEHGFHYDAVEQFQPTVQQTIVFQTRLCLDKYYRAEQYAVALDSHAPYHHRRGWSTLLAFGSLVFVG